MNENVWYSDALEVLSPLRWHLNELVEEMENYNRFAERMGYPTLSLKKIQEAKAANEKADDFFCPKEKK